MNFFKNNIIEAKKYWNSSEQNEIIKDYSHWKGVGRWENEKEWYNIGLKHYQIFQENTHNKILKNEKMLEWGTGGGSNILAFSKRFNKIFGVDISEPNLKECSDQVLKHSCKTNFYPVLLNDPEKPYKIINKINEKIDFFLSTAVYQHFPSKEYAVEVTKLCYEIMSHNGFGMIQIRYDSKEKGIVSKKRNYFKNVLHFTSFNIEEFWIILNDIGFKPKNIYLEPETNYAYFFFDKE